MFAKGTLERGFFVAIAIFALIVISRGPCL